MDDQRNLPKPSPEPDGHPHRLADLLQRNYAMMHRMQISHAVLGAEVQLLPNLLFEAIPDPATAAKARAIHDEWIRLCGRTA